MRIYVISAGRPGNVEKMHELLGDLPATWVVPDAQQWAYVTELQKYAPGSDDLRSGVMGDGGSLVRARNYALTDAFRSAEVCVQLSDDLRGVKLLGMDGKAHEYSLPSALQELEMHLASEPNVRLAGVAPTDNPFYGSNKINRRSFIVADLIAVAPCELRFDEQFTIKEDYDYTCQHIETYGQVLRLDWILASFAHRTNAGGAVAVRTPELEQQMITRLKEKWPGWIHDNPKRENEVLLRVPRIQTEVWT